MTNLNVANLFANLPESLPEEMVDVLVESKHVRIEPIVSTGQSSQLNFWYDQGEDEWVVVLKGHAKLRFEGDAAPLEMHPGDHVLIPAHRKHRVEWTTPHEPTVWLALFYSADSRQR
jgi:cupin 2 domain-containing protein